MADKIIETLGGGLATRRHPGLLEEGMLTVARDSEYRPDDPSPRVAAGRVSCGQSPTTNISLATPITALKGIAWPPGTKRDPDDATGDLKEFIYFRTGAPSGVTLLSTSVKDNPTDSSFDTEFAYLLYGGVTIPTSIPSGYMDSAFCEGEFFLFPGGHNYCLSRGTGGLSQTLEFHGVKRNTVELFITDGAGAGTGSAPAGYYNYWFTWADGGASPAREGTFLAPDLNTTYYGSNTAAYTWLRLGSDQVTYRSRLSVKKADFDAAKPANATTAYIYRTQAYDATRATTVVGAPTYLNWPLAWRITTVSLFALTEFTAADGEIHYHLAYDNFAITNTALNVTDSAPVFEVISVNDVPDGRDGEPPTASTGDAFEESLVTNDLANPTLVRFSYPGLPHSFPSTFYIRMTPPDGDEVNTVKTLGMRLFIGMRENIYRINWLPRESETDFSRGRVADRVARRGTYGPQAVCLFELPGVGPLIAYVSRDGLYMTDLDENRKVTGAIAWEEMISNPASCLLVNDIDKERLVLAYDSGVGFRDALLYLNYSEGKFRITGPIRRPGGIAALCEASTDSGSRVIASTDLSGTRLSYEDFGTTDGSDGTEMEMLIRTRDIYPAALAEEATLGRIFAHGDGDGSLSVKAVGKGNGKTLATRVTVGDVAVEPLLTGQKIGLAERVYFEMSATQNVRVNAVGAFWDTLGEIER